MCGGYKKGANPAAVRKYNLLKKQWRTNYARRSAGAGDFGKGTIVKYEVRIGTTEVFGFHFDILGDAIDFAFTCVENGYKTTIIPLESEEVAHADGLKAVPV